MAISHVRAVAAPQPAFSCPVCHRVSHHPDDIERGYCGACHEFTGVQFAQLMTGGFRDGLNAAQAAVVELGRVCAGLGLIIEDINSSRPSSAEVTGEDEYGSPVLSAPGGAEISRGLPQSPPEQWQAVPALPADPSGSAYNWRPGDPVLLKAQPGLDIYLDIYHTVPVGTKEVLLRLDEADHAELAKLAAGSDTSVTALIREGVAMVLGKYSDGRSPSPADYRAAAATLADVMDKLASGHVLVPRGRVDGTSWSGILDEGSS